MLFSKMRYTKDVQKAERIYARGCEKPGYSKTEQI